MKIQVLFEATPQSSFLQTHAVATAAIALSALVVETGAVPALRFRDDSEGTRVSQAEAIERRSPHGHHDDPDPNMLRMRHPVAASTSSLTLTGPIVRLG
jgi:hypothetical protein